MGRIRVFEQGVLSRRHFLHSVGVGGALALGLPGAMPIAPAQAATPKPGGVARVRGYDPLGWDAMLSVSYRTHIAVSYTHNRLFRYKAGPDVPIGTMILEPDLVERWEEPSDTRYILHLRQGVHFHDKPPVGGRELVAEDVRYSLERFLTVKGNASRPLLEDISEVKVLNKHTVQVDLKEPNVWILDYMAYASVLPIIAKEAVEQFGDLKQPESVIGTGPWMLAAYEPKVKSIFTKNLKYFRTGLPYIDEVQFIVLDDDSTASAAYMSGQLDFGWGFVNTIRLEELTEFQKRHPEWHYEQFLWNVSSYIYMHTDQPPFNDQRVRQAISMAINRQEMIDTIGMGQSKMNTVVPAALRDWHVPVDQLGDGARYYQYNPAEAKRLLKDAGHPQGFKTSMRIIRSATLSVKEHTYIEAARAVGASHWRILLRYILPNVMAPIIIAATVTLGFVILAEASLSFLGFGVPPPYPSWGLMLNGSGRVFMLRAPWMALWPGIAVSLAVFGFNMLGDALRDVLDPRLRGT